MHQLVLGRHRCPAQHQASSSSLLVLEGIDMGSLQDKGWDGLGKVEQRLPTQSGSSAQGKVLQAPALQGSRSPEHPQPHPLHHLGGRFNPNWKSNPSRYRDGHFTPIMQVPRGLQLGSAQQHPSAHLNRAAALLGL